MPDIQIDLDVTSAANASDQLTEILRRSASALGDFTVKTVQFNKDGKATSAVIEQIDSAGRKVARTFEITGVNAEQANAKITQSAATAQRAMEELVKSQRQATAGGFGGDISKLFPLPPSANAAGVAQYTSSIINLQRAFVTSGASAQQFQSMMSAANSNFSGFAASIISLPPNLQTLARSILGVASAAQLAGQAGNQFGITWQGLSRIIEVQLFRRAVTETINALRDGIRTASEFQIKLQQVANLAGQGGNTAAIGQNIRGISSQFAVGLPEAASAAQIAFTSQAGNSAAAMNVLNNAMRLSQATGVDQAATMRVVTSTLDAFRLSADQSSRVTNVLFQTAQRSRIPLEQLQTAIGRVGPIAQATGQDLETMVGLFLTIAQEGGRPAESFNRLNQVMGRFEAPSKALQQFLNSMGAPTAQAAISLSGGLIPFLQRLNTAVERSPELLNQFGGSLRTDIALLSLMNTNTERAAENIERLRSGAPGAVGLAAAAVAQTPAFQIQQMAQEVKNAFALDIGGPFLGTLASIVNGLGGAKAALLDLLNAVQTLAYTYATFRVATFIGGINATTIAVTAAIAAYQTLVSAIQAAQAAERKRTQDAVDAIARETQQRQGLVTSAAQRESTAFTTGVNQQFAGPQQAAANAVSAATQARDEILAAHREIAQSWQTQTQAFVDTLRTALTGTRQLISQNRAELHASNREVQNFQERARAQSFQNQLQAARSGYQGGGSEQQLITGRMQELQIEIQRVDLNRNATREEVGAARNRFGELLRLNNEYWSAVRQQGTQAWQAIFQQMQPALNLYAKQIEESGGAQYGSYLADAFRANVQQVNQQAMHPGLDPGQQRQQQESINDLVRQVEQFENRHRDAIVASTRALERQLEVQRTNLRTVEQQIRNLEQFRAFDAQGRLLRPEWQTAEQGRQGAGFALAQQELERRIANARREMEASVQAATAASANLPSDQRTELQRQLQQTVQQFNAAAEQRRTALRDEFTAQQNVQQAVTNQRQLQEEINNLIRDGNNLINRRVAAQNQGLAAGGGVQQGIRILQDSLARLQLTPGATFSQLGRADEVNDAGKAWNRLLDAINAVDLAQQNYNRQGGQTQANADALRNTAEELQTAASAARQFSGGDIAQAAGLAVNQGGRIDTLLREIAESRRPGAASAGNISAMGFGAQTAQQQVTQLQTAIQENSQQVSRLAGPTSQLVQPINNLTEAINSFAARLSQQGIINAPGVPAGAPAGFFGGMAGHFAYGGPVGKDTIPAWLSPGEFVVNAGSTQRFYTQLLDINRGKQPRYFSSGGPVTVGDINVSVNGGDTSEKSIREIARGLNRELRRGTVTFQTLQEKS